jgi:hypothetical protein
MSNEYKVEYRLFKASGNEYQMRKIHLKENSEDEARQVLIEMGYIKRTDKMSILTISQVQKYSNYRSNRHFSFDWGEIVCGIVILVGIYFLSKIGF